MLPRARPALLLQELSVALAAPPPGIQGSPAEPAPPLRSLSLCVATAAASPAHIAALLNLTSLQLAGLYDDTNFEPLRVGQLTALMGSLASLPSLRRLDWVLAFPFEHGPAAAAPGGAAAAGGGGAGGEEAEGDVAAPGGAADAPEPAPGPAPEAPDWGWLQGFESLAELTLEFNHPTYLEGSMCGARHLAPWLGLVGWVERMGRLERASIVYAGEEEEALRAALPPGAAYSTRR